VSRSLLGQLDVLYTQNVGTSNPQGSHLREVFEVLLFKKIMVMVFIVVFIVFLRVNFLKKRNVCEKCQNFDSEKYKNFWNFETIKSVSVHCWNSQYDCFYTHNLLSKFLIYTENLVFFINKNPFLWLFSLYCDFLSYFQVGSSKKSINQLL
jgi:hypothetical protein